MNVQKLIEILSNCNPKAEVILRDELRILQTTDGVNAKEGIYDEFRVLEWKQEGEGNPKESGAKFVSISFINEKKAKKVIQSN